jgi:hypothetical protein
MLSDGTIGLKSAGAKDWSITKQTGNKRHAVESNHNGDLKISREDFVTFSKSKNGNCKAEFECSTVIQTDLGEKCTITAPQYAQATFYESGRQEIQFNDSFKVERIFKEGCTAAIRVHRVINLFKIMLERYYIGNWAIW